MTMRTIVLKLREPSGRKKKIIDEALLNYTLAYEYLLKAAALKIEEVKKDFVEKNGKHSAKRLSKWVDGSFNKTLNEFSIEPFKDSIKIDFGFTMAGYLNRLSKGLKTEFPSGYLDKETAHNDYVEALSNFINYEDEDATSTLKKLNKLNSKSENLRPIFFCRYATNRNYSLLYDAVKNKYYAKIYLMNFHNENRKAFNSNSKIVLRYMSKDKEKFIPHGKAEGFLLFPLSFGIYQEEYLKLILEKPEIIKTARLYKKREEYFLAINLEICETNIIETVNFMGVTRGISNIVNYTVVNTENEEEVYGYETYEGTSIKINKIHEIANNLINIAEANKCQIIMERLVEFGDKLLWIDKNHKIFRPILGCYDYNRLYDILKYKLPAIGLPPPIRVSSIWIFNTCPRCSCNKKQNRFSEEVFICTNCGMSLSIEKLGCINVSKKLLTYKKNVI